jgi:hypothetical protein
VIAVVAGYAASPPGPQPESRSIRIGFGYLRAEAGFDISETLFAYDAASYRPRLRRGPAQHRCSCRPWRS